MQLKSELQNLRRKGAIKVSTDWDSTGPDPDRSCGRCRVELGRVINRGAYCRVCRLKVCKGCREYNFRSTDWVCTVCHKRMEIQAASGEWMNEFVRRPSRRRDTRVYVPAADIIKRTIRRSWTISNPTPRWSALRGSPELRPYNSLPRGQDINNYPTLALHRENLRNNNPVRETGRSPNRRTQSEDVYQDRDLQTVPGEHFLGENRSIDVPNDTAPNHDVTRKSVRVNPLLLLADNKESRERKTSPKRKTSALENVQKESETKIVDKDQMPSKRDEDKLEERHVSFDCGRTSSDFIARSRSLSQGKRTDRTLCRSSRSLQDDGTGVATDSEVVINASHVREEQERAPVGNPAELPCDIEPVSGTVFRKMTVRQRRQENMRKMPAVDAGWRRTPETDLLDFLLPDGEDYRLVFVSSDGSSKEEDVDDNDSSSASSFPIDECYWDYFEPGANKPQMFGWGSPFGSPRVCRKGLVESPIGSPLANRRRKRTIRESSDEDTSAPSPSDGLFGVRESSAEALQCMHQNQQRHTSTTTAANQTECHSPCRTCGGSSAAQFIPIPVPVPIPFPVPWGSVSGDSSNPMVLYKQLHQKQNLWQYFAQHASNLVYPAAPAQNPMIGGEDDGGDGSKETGEAEAEEEQEAEPAGHLESENRASSGPDSTSSDSSDSDPEHPRVSRVYNVSGSPNSRESDDALPSSNVTSDCDEENEPRCSDDEHEDEETSSGSADTDSNDTGTVADQKPKRFSRVFVVNHKGSSSSSSEAATSSNEDSSDNDTDTEMDCTVVLTNIKPLAAEEVNGIEELKLIGVKYFDEDGESVEAGPSRDRERETGRKFKHGRRHGPARTTKREKEDTRTNCGDGGVIAQVGSFLEREIASCAQVDVKDCDSRRSAEGDNSDRGASNEVNDKEEDAHESEEDTKAANDGDGEAEDQDDGSQEFEDSLNAIPAEMEWKLADEKPFEVSPGTERNESNFGAATPNAGDRAAVVKNTGYSSSPCLSDVSAESLSSSDAEKDTGSPGPERGGPRRALVGGAGVLVSREASSTADLVHRSKSNAGARYTSLVMITGDDKDVSYRQQVNVVTSHTTRVVSRGGDGDRVVVRHTNRDDNEDVERAKVEDSPTNHIHQQGVTVITGVETLSAFEEGLADDDSWVENLSNDDEEDDDFATNSASENSSSSDEVTLTCSAVVDQEDELRGYHRTAIDFTLHTIVEESCEESEVEQSAPKKKERPASATDLEKYFFFGLGDGTIPSINSNREDAFSETSSIYSEGMESTGGPEEPTTPNENSAEELASSRLEKYFLSGFMGFTAGRRDSDGSVGSDSEGKPSPEQRRKRLVRARGTGRSHSSSLDNLLANPDLATNEQQPEVQNNSEDSSSSDTDTYDEIISFEKSDGQFDTVKRKKGKKQKVPDESKEQEMNDIRESDEDEDGHKTPQPEILPLPTNLTTSRNQQSRDSGFVGSCDDLLRDQKDAQAADTVPNSDKIATEKREDRTAGQSIPPNTLLTRRDSFNNWSSDEETNLMMCKMRQFFKTMVANGSCSKPATPNLSSGTSPKPRAKTRCKPPQLVYFENELTRLMKTVPGIRDDQVREIVEYLSSEDTWSDSYDSSDYTSSDLEGASTKSALQQQISDSCKQIINKFDAANAEDEEGDAGDGGIQDDSHGLNKETAFVYQKLVASFEKMAAGDKPVMASGPNSPPLIAKVMHHIGSRLVALMHEVSSGESHASNSPKSKNYHRRLQQKLSNASSTTTDDDSTSDSNLPDTFLEEPYGLLPRSRSHDLLMSDAAKNMHQSTGGSSDIVEEREASDCERFSWRGSFESALLATDSRNKLSLIGGEGSASASALAIAAKRRSAGDLLFSHKSLSREQLDRVRSCGSIGGASSEDKLWATRPNRRRSSVPDAASCGSGGSADGEDEEDEMDNRATLPRSLQSGPQTTNSLPRLPTSAVPKAQSQYAKSARYRPPGFSRLLATTTVPKRAVSAPGLQLTPHRRGRRSQQSNVPSDDVSLLSEAHSSPMLATRGSKSATPSPVAPSARRKTSSISSQEWPTHEDDIDRLVALHHNRSSLSSLGLRSDSMASVYSGAGEGRYGAVTVRGQVEFGLQYNYKAGALEIQIKQCKDLAPVDIKRNRSDPYVKVYLLPDKSKGGKRKTKVKKHTLNPVFDECLKFHMSLNELEIRTLWLTVWHSDMFGRNDFLGEVMMTLENKVFDDPTPRWYNLQERTEPFDDMLSFKGDVIVCLKFVPPDMTAPKKGKRSRGALHVLVKEAKGLTAIKANGTSDPFCKSYLLPDKGRSSKQKTPVAKRTINPVWNHTFVYDDVTLQELAERCLELTVWDHDRLASNEFLGGVRFSLGTGKHYGKSVEWMDATGKELSLWKSMLERPNFWVEGCLALRPSLDTRAS
ncbi:uncharacterized protein LOC132702588 isoform X2 [Cylas formicarius]|uniref:uncharacterized protein LOC132702588 isoform X2 n=1 Tax=Cylas formicarius TaxID=197179 RepID=UPI002958BA26|nr:uncharacterized protein LOC132702588 isoform X2 [Cylas formicarius]